MSAGTPPEMTIALLSTSNLRFFVASLRQELRQWKWDAEIWASEFNQYRQDIWNGASELYARQPKVVILQLDGADLFMDVLRDPLSGSIDCSVAAQRAADDLEANLAELQERLPSATVILHTVYFAPLHALTGLEHHGPHTLSTISSLFNVHIGQLSRKHPNVLVHDIAALAAGIGYRNWFDPRLWYLARCRLSQEAMKALAQSTVSLLRAWKGQARKCVVLDLDNTLWGGIVGEDEMEGIALGEEGIGLAFAEFQDELLNLTRKGIMLAICSKNNEEDAFAVLKRHPSMRLKEDHFAAYRINWRDKATNMRELALELNLGLDSFVFIDDNPAERTLVRSELPEVLVPEWPQDPALYKTALLDLAATHLLKLSITEEDRARTSIYRAEGERRALLESSGGNLESYYRSLEMTARVAIANSFTIPRIAQLTQKTNQFNLTSLRYSEADIRALSEAPDVLVLCLALSDRFSDNGIVGVMILRHLSAGEWHIDTLLLSCRVIGRTVENAFVGFASRILIDRSAEYLIGEYRPTRKNAVTANLYRDLGFQPMGERAGITRWKLSLRERSIAIPEWIKIESWKEAPNA
ncbi:MAG: HAD-IIIC family phosphatase [Terriglobia bacterium]